MAKSDPQQSRAETATLVRSFLASATSAFSAIVAEPGASWSVGVEQAAGRGFAPVAPEQLTHVFVATGAFSNARVVGTITFGDREYDLNTILGPAGSPLRYGLWEWADALERPTLVPRNTSFVMTVSRLEAIVDDMARAVDTLQGQIALARPAVLARLDGARACVQTAFESRLRGDGHRRAVVAAAEALRNRDYRRVVVLLEPYTDVLTTAEQKKLDYARVRL